MADHGLEEAMSRDEQANLAPSVLCTACNDIEFPETNPSLEGQEKGAQRLPACIVDAITEPRRRRLVQIVRQVAD
jgi:hypothetical protein